MSNFLIEGPGGIPQIKIQGGYNSALPVTTTGKLTGGSGQVNGGLVVTGSITASGGITGAATVISGSGATVTLTAAQSRSLVMLDRAAGIIFTLPAPVVGLTFSFFVNTSVTTNNYKVITDAGTTFLIGSLVNIKTDLTTLFSIGNGSTHLSVTMNGTTTGGLVGTYLRFTCVSATQWLVEGANLASGTIATPFATS